jgi:hypothetical protein
VGSFRPQIRVGHHSLTTNFIPNPTKIAPADGSIQILLFRYRLLKWSKEKIYTTDVYQKIDIRDIRAALMNPSQKGAFEGMVAANKLVTKAAVFIVIKKVVPGVTTATPQMIATLSSIIENFIKYPG